MNYEELEQLKTICAIIEKNAFPESCTDKSVCIVTDDKYYHGCLKCEQLGYDGYVSFMISCELVSSAYRPELFIEVFSARLNREVCAALGIDITH